MEIKELVVGLKEIELNLLDRRDGSFCVGSPKFANPIIIFTPSADYTGSVVVKSINSRLFTASQIAQALNLVDKYLYNYAWDQVGGDPVGKSENPYLNSSGKSI